jgi:hypothetical protein
MSNPPLEHSWIEKVRNRSISEDELIRLYRSARTVGALDLMKEIRLAFSTEDDEIGRLNQSAPAEHRQAWADLNKLRHELFMEYDLVENRHDCHVKAGGSHLTGKHSFAYYISYKNGVGGQVSISIHQQALGGPMEAVVHAGPSDSNPVKCSYPGEWAQAAEKYKSLLLATIRST